MLPEIERQQRMGKEVAFRGDAAFAKPEVYEALEGRGVKHARYYWPLLAESHLTKRLFAAMVERIDRLPMPAG